MKSTICVRAARCFACLFVCRFGGKTKEWFLMMFNCEIVVRARLTIFFSIPLRNYLIKVVLQLRWQPFKSQPQSIDFIGNWFACCSFCSNRTINFNYRNRDNCDDESHANNFHAGGDFHIVWWASAPDDAAQGFVEEEIQLPSDDALTDAALERLQCHRPNDEATQQRQRSSHRSGAQAVDGHRLAPFAVQRHSRIAGQVPHHSLHSIPAEALRHPQPAAEETHRAAEDAAQLPDRRRRERRLRGAERSEKKFERFVSRVLTILINRPPRFSRLCTSKSTRTSWGSCRARRATWRTPRKLPCCWRRSGRFSSAMKSTGAKLSVCFPSPPACPST